ncbi:hypothetical protein BFP77_15355 [Maribacter sp. 4U21]|uniref:DUF262 domain-containing protein n=1 Tax=Maribacter sp. 4U21 TaxID=1889779 RepID=UPI000C1480A9|nr:DUF262 domain-containing protein [Maribacter sp. 4U21]PIB23692.1 hypothetical protein BFP77_15355 [Maribacter sp. 4U21]
MAVSNLLDTSTVSLSDVIGNGKTYEVPPYQRDYSWKKDQWEDLWNDINNVYQSNNVHYMGSIVLQDLGDKNYHVIDGQQRFSTLTLIVLATISKLQELVKQNIDQEQNTERISLLQKKFIGDKDPGSLTYSSKLKLNENNNSFFQTNLLVQREPTNPRTLIDSDKLIWNAYHYFTDKISNLFKKESNGEIVANFLNKIVAEKLMFIQIIVEDELSAYTVFETLNSRGVGLTVTDLLKNYLFSVSSKVDLPHIKEKWKSIVETIGLDNFPTFLRHYWVSKNKLIRQEYLFRALREYISTSPQVIELLDNLDENSKLYNAISNYSDSFWGGHREIKKRIKELTLFKEKQAYPLLISSYNNLTEEKFSSVLKFVSVITFRYTVISKLHTNLKEDIYNKAAIAITQNPEISLTEIATLLKPLYPNDKEFKNSFVTKSISTKRGTKLVRYILFNIENHLNNVDYDFEENSGTIEHILPENGNQHYLEDFPQAIHDSIVYRLGNYTILEGAKNRECSDLPFADKKDIYITSRYEMTKNIANPNWTPNSIDNRQEWLGNQASSVWRISQLD